MFETQYTHEGPLVSAQRNLKSWKAGLGLDLRLVFAD